MRNNNKNFKKKKRYYTDIRVINSDGEMIGIMDFRDGKSLARDQNLDLVEINSNTKPPVFKIMDYGKFKYEEKKKKKPQKKQKLKEIKLRPKTDTNDLNHKIVNAKKFLEEGNKVKITCRFRGREVVHPEVAQKQLDLIIKELTEFSKIESEPRLEGRTMMCIIGPKASKK